MILAQEFHIGINGNFGDSRTGAAFSPMVFTIFDRWADLAGRGNGRRGHGGEDHDRDDRDHDRDGHGHEGSVEEARASQRLRRRPRRGGGLLRQPVPHRLTRQDKADLVAFLCSL